MAVSGGALDDELRVTGWIEEYVNDAEDGEGLESVRLVPLRHNDAAQ